MVPKKDSALQECKRPELPFEVSGCLADLNDDNGSFLADVYLILMCR